MRYKLGFIYNIYSAIVFVEGLSEPLTITFVLLLLLLVLLLLLLKLLRNSFVLVASVGRSTTLDLMKTLSLLIFLIRSFNSSSFTSLKLTAYL